ncbi:MAG: flippase-like domain-containing protein [Rhodobiaceae bacterium]|nr:flippase-like domain-containing protein [Rhodobiaceae bacterium]MCC0054721.1 flippase-like domain-containing protein [Rhodobiaceae bacterium]
MARLLAIFVSAATVALLYLLIDVDALGSALAQTDMGRLVLSLVLLMLLIQLSAVRLVLLARISALEVGLGLATRAVFAANALNLFMPSKLGDLAKASMLRSQDGSMMPAFNMVLAEKLADLLAVMILGAVALAAYSGEGVAWFVGALAILTAISALTLAGLLGGLLPALEPKLPRVAGIGHRFVARWREQIGSFRRRPFLTSMFCALTLLIWAGHLAQIAMMAWALGVSGPWEPLIAIFPIVILAGLLPMTIAGIGPRDMATVAFAGPLIGTGVAAALGILLWLRIIVPGLAGLPFTGAYFRSLRRSR